jgi:pyruvate/2-oxoglutarate/acetoin dehydrogenase E1 component
MLLFVALITENGIIGRAVHAAHGGHVPPYELQNLFMLYG